MKYLIMFDWSNNYHIVELSRICTNLIKFNPNKDYLSIEKFALNGEFTCFDTKIKHVMFLTTPYDFIQNYGLTGNSISINTPTW
jgi:hypothetical protein